MAMQEFHILIADRNPNVRVFLKREMVTEGYRIRLAENGREVLKWSYHQAPLDLLILDPDLPDADVSALLQKLADRIPALPVVVHAFASEFNGVAAVLTDATFVEKKGNSVERLKQVVFDLLNRPVAAEGPGAPFAGGMTP